jgi:hypothetical protein
MRVSTVASLVRHIARGVPKRAWTVGPPFREKFIALQHLILRGSALSAKSNRIQDRAAAEDDVACINSRASEPVGLHMRLSSRFQPPYAGFGGIAVFRGRPRLRIRRIWKASSNRARRTSRRFLQTFLPPARVVVGRSFRATTPGRVRSNSTAWMHTKA